MVNWLNAKAAKGFITASWATMCTMPSCSNELRRILCSSSMSQYVSWASLPSLSLGRLCASPWSSFYWTDLLACPFVVTLEGVGDNPHCPPPCCLPIASWTRVAERFGEWAIARSSWGNPLEVPIAVIADVEGGRNIPLGKEQTHSRVQAVVAAQEGGMEVLPWHLPRVFADNLTALPVETSHIVVGCLIEVHQVHLLSLFQNLTGSGLIAGGWFHAMRHRFLSICLVGAVMISRMEET